MSTIADQVRACVARDPYLRRDLARDVISHAKLARWMRDDYGIPGTEHAIMSALRRLDPLPDTDPFAEAREIVEEAKLSAHTHVSAISVKRRHRYEARKPQLHDAVPVLALLEGKKTATFVIESDHEDKAAEILGPDITEERRSGLAIVFVKVREAHAGMVQEVLTLLLHELSIQGLSPKTSYTEGAEAILVFEETDHVAAMDVLDQFVS